MFIAWTKDTLTPDEMLANANSINTALKVTVETPEDNCLPFLDITAVFPRNFTWNLSTANVSRPRIVMARSLRRERSSSER